MTIPPKLQTIIEDFGYCQGQEKLEYLLEFSQTLPPLPEWLEDKRDDMDQVHECMSPVFIYAQTENNIVTFHFDIPAEAPTVRGFASLLSEGLNGSTIEEIQAVPLDIYRPMGLHKVITGQRLNGLSAVIAHMKALL
ncbi:MAG TPA: SufE family protein [Anaerolineae bacterium]|nr:SufE family protein [Anaerolineae bacterium]